MRAKPWCLIAVAYLTLLAWMPALADESAPVAVPVAIDANDEFAESCVDYTPVEGVELEPALLLGVEQESVAPKPKPCRQACPNAWCECTYNGAPRISCDPCCYQTYAGPICTS